MRNHRKTRGVILSLFGLGLCCGLLVPNAAHAGEIVSLFDEHGHRIFVNEADLPSSPILKKAQVSTSLYASRSLLPTQRPTPPSEISKIVAKTAGEHRVDPNLVHAI